MRFKVLYSLFALFCVVLCGSLQILAATEEGDSKAPATGGYVEDPAVSVPAGAYTTFSTVYNGKRYYLGVDTVQAKLGKDTVTFYEGANYAAMWIAGPLWSPTGEVLPNKNYQRTVKSAWIYDKCNNRERYLTLGAGGASYSALVLRAEGAMWYTEKDSREQSRYIQGFMYYHSDASGVDVYRYLTYDPLYGFSRAFSSKPANSQRISVWDRKTGDNMYCDFDPKKHTFGLNLDKDNDTLQIVMRMTLELDGDYFRSRYDGERIVVKAPTVIASQRELHDTYKVKARLDWASGREAQDKRIYSWFPVAANTDSMMMKVDTAHIVPHYDPAVNNYTDTLYAIGHSPVNLPDKNGVYRDHADYLHIHMFYPKAPGDTVEYIDSMQVIRLAYRSELSQKLEVSVTPQDKTFEYFDDSTPAGDRDDEVTFTFYDCFYSAEVLYRRMDSTIEKRDLRERIPVHMDALSPVVDGEGHHLNELLVSAYLADGTTPAIGSDPRQWIESVTVQNRNQIRVKAKPRTDPSGYLTAQLKVSCTYRRSLTDTCRMVTTLWLFHEPAGAGSGIITFEHQSGASGLPMVSSAFNRQQVPELCLTYYHIPEEENPLPIHHDEWGYYRWFIYQRGANRGKDIANNWTWTTTPKTSTTPAGEFVQLNSVEHRFSRGRVAIDPQMGMPYIKSAIPAVKYKSGATASTYTDTLACDISSYTDTTCVGPYGSNMTYLKEPTLSYRQLFAMRPAKESADAMANCLKRSANYMQKDTVLAPIGQPFLLQPKSPYKLSEDGKTAGVGNLQYVYYCNPDTSKDGMRTGLSDADLNHHYVYNRIGVQKNVDPLKRVRSVTVSQINSMGNNTSKYNLLLVNVRQGSAYILGNAGNQVPTTVQLPNCATEAELRGAIEELLNDSNADYSGGYYLTLNKYKPRVGSAYYQLINNSQYLWHAYTTIIGGAEQWNVRWFNNYGTGSKEILFEQYEGSNDRIPSGIPSGALMTLYADFDFDVIREGYYSGGTINNAGESDYRVCIEKYNRSNQTTANQAWLIYEVYTDASHSHEETAYWERSLDNGTTWVRRGSGWAGTELDGGALRTSFSGSENQKILYRLMSNHFQLAHFTVYLRGHEGPSATPILSEDEIQRDYNLVASLGLEQIPAAGSKTLTTPYHRFAFNHTEFGYHYPVGDGEHQVPTDRRVFDGAMPAKGEYVVTNMFVNPANSSDTVEACAGAEYGYMYCFNRAIKPMKFIDFTYDRPACTDQEFMLVANFCNPTTSALNPHVKADYYGHKPGAAEGTWTHIYTFLTGNIPQGGWYQVALPLDTAVVNKYDEFRCVGTVSGCEGDAYLLFDRFRLLAKNIPMTFYQKRTTCKDENNMIQLVTRIDYESMDESLLAPGKIICYQYQGWDDAQNKYVPLQASRNNGGGSYTRLDSAHTQVWPGYYKVGLDFDKSVETAALKSKVLGADYGMVVIPNHGYDPSSGATDSKRKEVIDYVTSRFGGTASDYYDESSLERTQDWITISEQFDIGTFDSPTCKFYVDEGTAGHPHWVMYIITRLPVSATDNNKFRIALSVVDKADSKPNFANSECSTTHELAIKGNVDIRIDGKGWNNASRAEAAAADTLLNANSVHTLSLRFPLPEDGKEGTTTSCKFDLLRAFDFMDGYIDMTPEQQREADRQWVSRYGCNPGEFQEAMILFRSEAPNNPNRDKYNWNEVSKESFHWSAGYSTGQADSAYNLLDRLITVDRLLEIGMDARDIYIGNNQDLYYYVRPIPASGRYTTVASDGTDSIAEGIICNNALWLELHSKPSNDSLRFGYDKQFGHSYAIPVIRAAASVANTALPVRISAISHSDVAHQGVVIGWDSTYVIETNDPAWDPATSSFRYTQDRIVQERLYSGYYKQGDIVTFRPVDQAHINLLKATDCRCYDYNAAGTVYDPSNPATVGNVFRNPNGGAAMNGCNQWHVLPNTESEDLTQRKPGFHKPNNFTLHAGYWYKFRTAFFHVEDGWIPYNEGDFPSGANRAYFILAVAPDTARWTPSHPEGANYWNDDENWTAIVNGADFHESLARVPMEDTRVIVTAPTGNRENELPIVNHDSLGNLDWGFKTATCKDVLFKPRSQMLGQELLDYQKAFVDVLFYSGTWQTFSPALEHVYSGDMYIPSNYNGSTGSESLDTDAHDFDPQEFTKGSSFTGSFNPRVWPYVFYQGFYNSSVPVAYYNTDLDGTPVATTTARSKNSVDWVKTNVLDMPYHPGAACIINGYGMGDDGEALIVRLPKKESAYHGFGEYPSGSGNYKAGPAIPMQDNGTPRPAYASLEHNLAYDKFTLGEADGITYTIHNETPSEIFFFGNPTMSLVDVYTLCKDNASVLQHEEGTYHFTAYQLIEGSNYTVKTITGLGQYFVAPQRAVGLIANAPATSLTVKLKPGALVAITGEGTIVSHFDDDPSPAPRRIRSHAQPEQKNLLYIAAVAEATDEWDWTTTTKAYLTLGESTAAHRGFRKGEDALSIVSGLNYYNDGSFSTPLSMYTIADNQALMLDIRDTLNRVPLVFATLDAYTISEFTRLSFALEGQWETPLYLYDAVTNDSIRIVNGLQMAVQTPDNNQLRYFINGGQRFPAIEPADPGVPTDISDSDSDLTSNSDSGLTTIYDLLGRKLMTLGEFDLISNIQLPTGVYIIQRGNNTERMVIR